MFCILLHVRIYYSNTSGLYDSAFKRIFRPKTNKKMVSYVQWGYYSISFLNNDCSLSSFNVFNSFCNFDCENVIT